MVVGKCCTNIGCLRNREGLCSDLRTDSRLDCQLVRVGKRHELQIRVKYTGCFVLHSEGRSSAACATISVAGPDSWACDLGSFVLGCKLKCNDQ
jgi:hypothetical protein